MITLSFFPRNDDTQLPYARSPNDGTLFAVVGGVDRWSVARVMDGTPKNSLVNLTVAWNRHLS